MFLPRIDLQTDTNKRGAAIKQEQAAASLNAALLSFLTDSIYNLRYDLPLRMWKGRFFYLWSILSDCQWRQHGANLRKGVTIDRKEGNGAALFCEIDWTAACRWQDNLGYNVTQYFQDNEVEMNKHRYREGRKRTQKAGASVFHKAGANKCPFFAFSWMKQSQVLLLILQIHLFKIAQR